MSPLHVLSSGPGLPQKITWEPKRILRIIWYFSYYPLFSCFSDKISCITLYSSATNPRHLFIRGINRNVVKIRGSTLFATSAPLRGIKARLPAVGSAVVGNSLFRVFGVFRGSNFGCGKAALGPLVFIRGQQFSYWLFRLGEDTSPCLKPCENRSVLGRASSPNEPLSQELQP
jgi:hypothetical protein